MPVPNHPRRTRRNQPPAFRESIAPVVRPAGWSRSAPPSRVGVSPRLSDQQLLRVLLTVWAAAIALAVLGLARLMTPPRQVVAVRPVPPTPIARANVVVTSAPSSRVGLVKVMRPAPVLAVRSTTGSASVNQATSGQPATAPSLDYCQPAGHPEALQPGFVMYGSLQGRP